MFTEIDEGPGCQQRIRQMAILTVNNHNAFHSLDLNDSRVSKSSRSLDLQGRRDLGEGHPDSPSSFSPRVQTKGDVLICTWPQTTVGTAVCLARTQVQPTSYGTCLLIARVKGRGHNELQSPRSEMEKLKRSWRPWGRCGRQQWALRALSWQEAVARATKKEQMLANLAVTQMVIAPWRALAALFFPREHILHDTPLGARARTPS